MTGTAQKNGAAIDPLRALEYPAAVFIINITLFVIVWKSVGIGWLPYGLNERFQEVFTGGYYPRDMAENERGYNLLFFWMYGVLGTAAQLASLRIAWLRRKPGATPVGSRAVFAVFHVLIATYHTLFVFQLVKGKLLLMGMPEWQMLATKALYLLELAMACELILSGVNTFYRRKVCLDVVSACNLIPLLVFWAMAAAEYKNDQSTYLVGAAFFTCLPLAVILLEYGAWCLAPFLHRVPAIEPPHAHHAPGTQDASGT